jgi:Flp pilus assembly protein TadD/predicted aspartyl protease
MRYRMLHICAFVLLFPSAFALPPEPSLAEAENALFAARYHAAAELYAQLIKEHPGQSEAHYGLVRALLGEHRNAEAYAAAEQALLVAPQMPSVKVAAGRVRYRQGDLVKAESSFREALKLDPQHPGALKGLAAILSAISWNKSARDLLAEAYRHSPEDPDLILAHANTLKGSAQIAALEEALAIYDPTSEEARNLRAHLAAVRACGDRKLNQLVSPYSSTKVKLTRIQDGPTRTLGVGILLQVNKLKSLHMFLDTGASGISLSPKVIQRAELEALGEESTEAKGIGDGKVQEIQLYLAAEVRAGDIALANCPISVFQRAKTPNYDGIIGTDVFQHFVVTVDFDRLEMLLEPRNGGLDTMEEPIDAGTPAADFLRMIRIGNHLAIPTSINQKKTSLFLIDSGASLSLIDVSIARETNNAYRVNGPRLEGVQGMVKEVSEASHVSLVFAGFRQDNQSMTAIDLEKLSDSFGIAIGGILGMPVLWQFKLTIDYREGTVRFRYKR